MTPTRDGRVTGHALTHASRPVTGHRVERSCVRHASHELWPVGNTGVESIGNSEKTLPQSGGPDVLTGAGLGREDQGVVLSAVESL